MRHIGIDCGLDGAVACLDSESGPSFEITPTIAKAGAKGNKRDYDLPGMFKILCDMTHGTKAVSPGIHVWLEQQQAWPDQGGVSNFSTGKGYGIWLGLLTACQLPFTVVHPRRWSGVMLDGMPAGDRKAMGAIVAQRLWPKLDMRASEKCRKPHEGVVDGFLIAEYGRRNYGRGSAGG